MNTGKGLLQRVYGVCGIIIFAAAAGISPAQGESLWEPGFSGYITPQGSVDVGDLLLIEISPQTELNLQSSHVDSVNARLSFSGGEGEELFDFLPEGSSEADRSVEQEDSFDLHTRIAVLVVDKDDNGLLTLRGERSVEINGLREHIVLSGVLAPSQLQQGRPIPFEVLSDAELVYSGVGHGRVAPLNAEDLERLESGEAEGEEQEIGEEPEEAEEPEGEEPDEAEGEEPAEDVSTDSEGERGYTISDERREELLLEYINRFINILFSR
ncbi:MAG: flagellar basal body L-ring protein FlgH [Spirochaetia bacterium]